MDFFRAFKSPSKLAQEYLFFTDGLGHLKSEDFLIDRKCFDNYLVMYVLSGKLHVEQSGHFILQKNEGIIMRLMDKHKYYTDETDTCEILWLHFNGRQTETFIKLIEQQSSIMPTVFKECRIEKLIRQCFTYFQQDAADREFQVSQAIYSIILSILYSISSENLTLNITSQMEFMNKATNYVDSNIYNKISLKDFAKHFNLSTYHFCRVFVKYFQTTPMKYVLQKKIEFSKYLLTYTHQSISSIATDLNFVDQSHFCKTFKYFLGKSPLSFRKDT